jgi:hypothetical protein
MVLARLAARQHGLVTLRQAGAGGLSYHHIRARLRAGTLLPVGRAVYRVAGAPRTWEQRALGACLAAGDGTVLCGRSAAGVWHLDLPEPRQIEVASVLRRGWTTSSREVAVRRVRALDAQDCTRVGCLPVTTVPRTIVDLAATLPWEALERVLDDALVRRLTAPGRVAATLGRLGGRGRAGSTALRRMLQPWLQGLEMDSVAEAAALRALAAAAIPTPRCQYPVVRADGAPAVLDFAWPERKLALEVDGFRWHASARAHARDSVRQNGLAAVGWTVLHATPTELAEQPAGVIAALRHHLGAG